MTVRNRTDRIGRQLFGWANRDVEEPAGSTIVDDPDEGEIGGLEADVCDLRDIACAVEHDPLLTRGVQLAAFRNNRQAAANLIPRLRVEVDRVFQGLPRRASQCVQPADVIK